MAPKPAPPLPVIPPFANCFGMCDTCPPAWSLHHAPHLPITTCRPAPSACRTNLSACVHLCCSSSRSNTPPPPRGVVNDPYGSKRNSQTPPRVMPFIPGCPLDIGSAPTSPLPLAHNVPLPPSAPPSPQPAVYQHNPYSYTSPLPSPAPVSPGCLSPQLSWPGIDFICVGAVCSYVSACATIMRILVHRHLRLGVAHGRKMSHKEYSALETSVGIKSTIAGN